MKKLFSIQLLLLTLVGCNFSHDFNDEAIFSHIDPFELPFFGTNSDPLFLKISNSVLHSYLNKPMAESINNTIISYQHDRFELILDFRSSQYTFKADESDVNSDFKYHTTGSFNTIGSVVQLDLSRNQFLKPSQSPINEDNILNLLLIKDTSQNDLDSNIFSFWVLNNYYGQRVNSPLMFAFQEIIEEDEDEE